MLLYDYASSPTIPSHLKERLRSWLPTCLKKHTILAGPLSGLAIYTSWHDYPGAIIGKTEKPLLGWFRRNVRNSETWIDIGAHYGYTAIALARLVGAEGRVVAFEPILTTAGCLARTREINGLAQLTVIPFGLDSSARLRTHRLPTVRGMADSTLALNGRSEQILVSSFDSIWPSLCGSDTTIHGVKIDVQGMELDVLRGMQGALRRHRPVLIVELHTAVDRRAVLDVLRECGYADAAEPIEPDEEPGRPRYRDDCSYVFRYQR
jgi:FkbM family methyltransferase